MRSTKQMYSDDYTGKGLTGDFDPEGEFSDHFAYRGWKMYLYNKDGTKWV